MTCYLLSTISQPWLNKYYSPLQLVDGRAVSLCKICWSTHFTHFSTSTQLTTTTITTLTTITTTTTVTTTTARNYNDYKNYNYYNDNAYYNNYYNYNKYKHYTNHNHNQNHYNYTTLHRATTTTPTTITSQLQVELKLPCAASNHFAIHRWVRPAIHHSQKPTSPICFLSWNFRHCLVRYILVQHTAHV